MSNNRIDPREVLTYLNELGYVNITAQQLKEFIIDLKKLIKYDARYRDTTNDLQEETITELCNPEDEKVECSESDEDMDGHDTNNKENETDKFYSGLHLKKTESSKAKEVPKDKHIALHIYDSKKQKNVLHEHCIHIDQPNVNIDLDQNNVGSTKLQYVTNIPSSATSRGEITESTIKSIPPSSTRQLQSRTSKTSSKSKERKPKVAFIRPASAKPSVSKSDPVALYHFYQSEWKTSKIPGQDNRDDLRWAIRERMLGGPRMLLHLAVLLCSIIIIIIIHKLWETRNLPPGPWGLPIVGYLPWLNPKTPYLTLIDLAKKYGPVYSLSLGNVSTVVLTDPKLIRTLFAKDSTTGRAPLYVTHGIMQGYGIICAEGELWKDQRRFVHNCLRTLGGTKIGPQRKNMEQRILKHALEFVEYIKDTVKNTAIDPLAPLRHAMGSTINEIVFGRYWSRNDENWIYLQELQEEGVKLIGVAGPLNFLPFLRFLPTFKRSMSFLVEGTLKTHKFYQKIIDEETINLNKSRSNLGTDNYTNLLQGFLIEREKRKNTTDLDKYYNDKQFHHLLADVFGAGLDTTLTTLRWLILYLAKNEEIQRQVKQEIQIVIHDREPSMEDITSMPLTEACLAETQRIRSVVPIGIPHSALEEIEIDGYKIPKGCMIVPFQWGIHMNEKEFPNPEVFDPSRFINEEGKFFKPDYFMPFQVGKRMCVGDELARMLLFLFTTTILQNFTLQLEEEEKISMEGECGITLTPNPYKLTFFKK